MRILIGGDIVPTKSNLDLFGEGAVTELLGSALAELLSTADFSIFNLETPLVDVEHPITKAGPNLHAPTATVLALKGICQYAVGLANNHIMDQGPEGLKSTLDLLERNGLLHVGAGRNLSCASKPLFVTLIDGTRIGVYACAESEFGLAGNARPGANPFDPLESFDVVSDMKKQCDFALVLYHGGLEHFRYPSPNLQRVCRKFARVGADLVVCQHSHCIGCIEELDSSTLIYGQGNFLFDLNDSPYWQTSVVVVVDLDDNGTKIWYAPIRKWGNKVRLAEGSDRDSILCDFEARSKAITDPTFVEEKYTERAREVVDWYLACLMPGGRTLPIKALNKLSGHKLIKSIVGRKRFVHEINFIECESHRELFLAGLKDAARLDGAVRDADTFQ